MSAAQPKLSVSHGIKFVAKPLIVINECATGPSDTVVFNISLCECDEFLTI